MVSNSPKLKVLSSVARGTVFNLDKDKLTCGRAETNDIVIQDTSISSSHCAFIKNEISFLLKDQDSTNGCFVNNEKVKTKTLKNEDIIILGNVEFLYDSGFLKEKQAEKSKNKININFEEDNSTLPLDEMKNFSPFATKKSTKNAAAKKIIFLISMGLVVTAAALLLWMVMF